MSVVGKVRKRRPYAARIPPAERREQLLDAALVIVNRDGYDSLSIASVAAEAGVTRPVVYGAFTDLTDLSRALLDRTQQRAVDQIMDVFRPLLVDSVDLYVWASTHLRQLIDIVSADKDTWRPILTHIPGRPAEVSERIEVTRSGIKAIIADVIRSVGRSGIDPVIAAHAALGTLEEIGRQLLVEPVTLDVDACIETAEVLLRSIVETAPRKV
ncbi:TetR/AcrR family transcriptional regulator [Nocardioides sp. Kera G14]|uniref:TetR/AcrR family transcriptional regulator n=1 Tax=Nocardioides sp. Kera G14 TaxID=2884264 RepID=UPI001D0F5482|nr:TetR/AcrR family transcriptional regulator [Nocardioides sp. Kera G14]UDY23564.1 TetR/AcrR family transcriptional regulator [Nocardioides sp. Kera G14]